MQFLPGFITVVFITVVAGLVAYVGDRVGHQVGRRRLTLFGLRPKYTSTIVAVGTGMFIALLVTTVALVASEFVRTAFFRIGELNNEIHTLQAQADSERTELNSTRNSQIVLVNNQPIYRSFLILSSKQTDDQKFVSLSHFFDAAVRSANANYARRSMLRSTPLRASDPDVARRLRQQVVDLKPEFADADDVMLLAVADQNLFRGDRIHFAFEIYEDKLLASSGATLASIDVTGGSPVDFHRLIAEAQAAAVRRGMPLYYTVYPLANNKEGETIYQRVMHGRGRYRVLAKAATNLYPHSAALVLDFSLIGERG